MVSLAAIDYSEEEPNRFIFAAPTHDQAKQIYWHDIKMLIPRNLIISISETVRTITLFNGCQIQVLGMDKPERVEGSPVAMIAMDEYGNMKEETWSQHVRPALADSGGSAVFLGVPEGRNHYFELKESALKRRREGKSWDVFHWPSWDILPEDEIEAAKSELDDLTFRQEFGGEFISFEGRIYYGFSRAGNANKVLKYYRNLDLVLCFDFNVSPGTASIVQEVKGQTHVIDEVWIARNSNTLKICDEIVERYGGHPGTVYLEGDATGGAKGTAKVAGSDWDLVKAKLKGVFGERLWSRVPSSNPSERSRVNAVNSRLCSADGVRKLHVCPKNCPKMIQDFEGVRAVKGGSGEIDKKTDPKLTHLTDGLGYYVCREFPVERSIVVVGSI